MPDNELSKRAAEVATEVIFLRSASPKAAVIVEGASDARLISRFLSHSDCEVIVADNKENALKVAEVLTEKNFAGFVVLVDRDFDQICGVYHENDNVIYVDDNDIDVMIFRSSALHTLLVEYGSKNKIDAVGGWEAARDLIAKEARKLGAVRLLSHLGERNLRFSGLNHDFICRRTFTSDQTEVVRRVLHHSQIHNINAETDCESVARLLEEHRDVWLLCQGHDLASYLGRALQSFLGTKNANDVASDVISRLLRLSYDSSDFEKSEIKQKIITWQSNNAPFNVLRHAA